jgi:multiple sugar transport system substrate-binding protein
MGATLDSPGTIAYPETASMSVDRLRRPAIGRRLLIALGVVTLAACGSGGDARTRLHFMMWRQHQPEPLERAIRAFEDARPDVEVVRRLGSENVSDYYREVTTKLRNQDPDVDVFFLDVIWPAEFAARGYLEPLDARLGQAERDAFVPAPLEADTVDGTLYAVPFSVDVGLLYYRADLLTKYGFEAPRTWDDLVRQADTILAGEDDPDLTGYAAQFDRYEGLVCNVLELLTARGGSLADASGQPTIDTPELVATLTWIRDELIHNAGSPRRASDYLLTAKEQQSRDVFVRGDAVFLREWPEAWKIANDPAQSAVAGRVAMAPLPAFDGGRPAGTLGGWQLGLAAHSAQKDLAWTFITHLVSHEIQTQLAIDRAQAMARLSTYDDPDVLAAMPHFGRSGPWGRPLLDAALGAVPRPRSVRYSALSERLQRCFHEAIRLPDSDIPALVAACADEVARLGVS